MSKVEETEREAVIKFEITDTGIGIPNDVQQNLFQPFHQADGSTARKYGGTGLGLAISKQLVERMGGSITVTSKLRKGSTFAFTARLRKPLQIPLNQKPQVSFAGERVLIVDDNATNREIVRQYLTSWNITADEAIDGPRALNKLRAAHRKANPFTVVILDMQMPGMDGVTVAKKIKADPRVRSVKLLLLSSLGDQLNAATLEDCGIENCLIKPIKKSRLQEVLTNSIERIEPQQRRSTSSTTTKPKSSRLRILVAEDNIVNQKVAVGQLTKLGYTADVAANGLEVLRAIEAIPYQLILMDCQMPEMDGYEATRRVRKHNKKTRTKTIIVAMTANAMQGDREKCLAAGMDDYIAKPIRLDALRATIAKWEAEVAGARPVNGHKVDDKPVTPVNWERLEDFVGDDPSAMTELLQLYVRETTGQLAQVKAALKAKDGKKLAAIAHTGAGASSTCGVDTTTRLFRKLEQLAKSREFAQATKLYEELKLEHERVAAFIANESRTRFLTVRIE